MTRAERHLMTLFGEALEFTWPPERAAYLDRACGSDQALRQHVEALLEAHAQVGRFLDPQAAVTGATSSTAGKEIAEAVGHRMSLPQAGTEGPGTQIGPYKLIEQIGEGGMGSVWMAQQTEPVKRPVALKLIRAGMDSRQVIARFEAERQALALMDHPNIARVLDGGTTRAGRPYFVMDLVKGMPITEYCDEHRLTPRQRLELFIPVCHAVRHAHQKGIIHRDLKPSNVLVALYDGRPLPKVIDFGVAKAAGQSLTDKTLVTGLGNIVGTLEYMSPEQAEFNQLDIDTRSDVYSLGVLLYELLTGSPPFSRKGLEKGGVLEMLRVIREQEPTRPSTKLSTAEGLPTLAANRGTEPTKLAGLVRGELDWIVMKALEKDRNRRYDSANAFALDVQRYLADEPVQACPPSVGYRLRKFVRRNKRALTPVVLLGAMLLATLAVTAGSVGWVVRDRAARETEANRELDRALQEAASLRDRGDWPQARAALQRAEWLLAGGASEVNRQRVGTMRTELQMAWCLEEIRLAQPRMTLFALDGSGVDEPYATAFKDYGLDVPALDVQTAAERIRASAIRPHLMAALDDWMWAKLAKVRNYELFRNRPDAVATQVKVRAEYEHLRAVADVAVPDEWCRRVRDPQVQRDRKALEKLADRPGVVDLPPSTVILLARLLAANNGASKAAGALRAIQNRYPQDFLVNYELAVVLAFPANNSRLEEAIGFMRAAVVLRPEYPVLHLKLGDKLRSAKRIDEAAIAYRTAVELQRGHESALERRVFDAAYGRLAAALEAQGKWDEALAVYARHAAASPNESGAHNSLGQAYLRRRQWDKGIAAWQEAVRLAPKNYIIRGKLAWLLLTCPNSKCRDPRQAVTHAGVAADLASNLGSYRNTLGLAHLAAGDPLAARAATRRAVELRPDDLEQCFMHAAMLLLTGDSEGYQQLRAHLLERGDKLECLNQPGRRSYLTARICLLAPDAVAAPAGAAQMAAEAMKAAPKYAWHLHTLGLVQHRAGRHEEAIKRFKEAIDASPRWTGQPANLMALAMAHHRLGRADQAQQWFDKSVQRIDHDRGDTPERRIEDIHAHDWVAWLVLRREAEALIKGSKK